VPEGDSLHRAAQRLQVLVGECVEVETPHPRAAVKGLARRLDGRRLEAVEAVGKNLLLRFEGGLVLRSHLRMTGRWLVGRRGAIRSSSPWLVLRGRDWEAVQLHGPVLSLTDAARVRRLGPDVLAPGFEPAEVVARLRAGDGSRRLGEALQDQRVVAGIGNMWMSEAAWAARLSPWLRVRETTDEELRVVVGAAATMMRAALDGGRPRRQAYRRAGIACRRCGTLIRSRGQGDANRTAYWCPGCQRPGDGGDPPPAP
jgi:endonuclease-8